MSLLLETIGFDRLFERLFDEWIILWLLDDL